MREISESEVKKIELNILTWFVRICEENGLKYFLFFGSLIGAVRHKGFIPWDDDIDVVMPNDDLTQFLEITKDDSEFAVLSVINGSSYYSITKIVDKKTAVQCNDKHCEKLGVWIDVFSLNDYSKHINMLKLRLNLYKYSGSSLARYVPSQYSKTNSFFKWISYILFRKKDPYKYALKIKKILNNDKGKADSRKYIIFINGRKYVLFDKELFSEAIQVDFENLRVKIPKEYDVILREIYGDYMKLPPEEKRVAGHAMKAYYRDND